MKIVYLLAAFSLLFTLSACPKKQAETEEKAEPAEGSSSAGDKSGEGSSDEMQEKKGSALDAAEPPAEGDDKKKD